MSGVAFTVFIFLFSASGAVNAVLAWLGAKGPNWFADATGVLHIVLGAVGVGGAGTANTEGTN